MTDARRCAAALPAVLLMGPTASGKSAIALALALRFSGEIISADSAQVYRGMDIGTAKPDRATRARVAHHLIDVIDPIEAWSAARFRAAALAAIEAVRARGRLPIIAGGTMLYFKALTEGLTALPPADATLRATIEARAARLGWPALHRELARVDPAAAARLAPADGQRIQRALEVHALTGRPLSELHGSQRAGSGFGPWIAIKLVPSDRARLHAVIAARFDVMLEAGLVDEVRQLAARWTLDPALPSMRCVGYRQVLAWLACGGSHAALREQGIAATRQLARRQLTWLRRLAIDPVDSFAPGALKRVEELVAAALYGHAGVI